ncbi:MAG: long-chain fatty acid--CoA ligase [Alphaproteobacteria bacterium]|jgi:long-chain acyl-CoA synthetase|nr:long-chain fatty acid--CoA ligase [Alphaproteobacteria bacterium]MDP6516187.1 long-chain fatty acid--CoA ligase [Alphaproteobacteria bacterium]
MQLDSWPNLVAMFFDQARRGDDRPFLWAKREGDWRSTTWAEAAGQVVDLARALRAYGVAPGDRVLLVAENSPEWAIADFAIMAAGAVTVPAYTTNTAADHIHLLTDSGAVAAIVTTAPLAGPLLAAARDAPDLERVITRDTPEEAAPEDVAVTPWHDALRAGSGNDDDITGEAAAIGRDSLACLIYTSGTGGLPKGVMLSHRAMMANCVSAYHVLLELGLDDEVFLSFLPLSHSYEHSAGLMFPVSVGAQIYYAEGIDRLASNMVEVQPTIMTAVPRLYEVMRLRILDGVRRAGGLKAKLFGAAVRIGRKRYEQPASLSLGERLIDALVDKLVRDKVRGRFGGRLKAMVSGGAPLNYEVGVFFTALGLRLLQGYGQTEAAPVISCNIPSKIKLETVGPPLEGVEVRIAEDGEILVRGALLMDGYWNQPETTAETLVDGWLHTGDIGLLDEDGYIRITDRKKDIIVLSGGDNVSPQRIEGILCLEEEIEQAMVAGDKKKHLVGLIVPSQGFLDQWAKISGAKADMAALKDDPGVHKALGEAVTRANQGLSVIEQVKRFTLAEAPFTTDNEMMTPTMKNRRHKILAHYGDRIEALF